MGATCGVRGGLGTGISRKTGIHEGAVWSQVVQYIGSQAFDYERIKDKGHIWGQRAETRGFSLGVDQGSNQKTKTEVLRCYWRKGQRRSLFVHPSGYIQGRVARPILEPIIWRGENSLWTEDDELGLKSLRWNLITQNAAQGL